MRKLTDEVVEELTQTDPSQQVGENGERLHIPTEIFNNFASLFNCTPVGRASDSMMAPT